jgi:uncharacterized protein (TIGR02145 family)
MKRIQWLYHLTSVALITGMFFLTACEKGDEDKDKGNTVTDINGNVYKIVKIGDQWWMAENLRTTKYRNGDAITNVTDDTEWSNLSTGAYCNYNNTASFAATYGCFYNWYAVNDSRNIAPEGWHVATDAEWATLANYLGGVAVAGGKLKEAGTTHWNSPNEGATNESGFQARASGGRVDGAFGYMGMACAFWTATEVDASTAWTRELDYDAEDLLHGTITKSYGFNVRCIKD